MDVQMPVMDGYEATRILRTHKDYAIAIDTAPVPDSAKDVSGPRNPRSPKNPKSPTGVVAEESKGKEKETKKDLLRDIPVIAMTASAIQGDREKCHEAGMDDYLAKPVERSSLEEMLVKWASRKREE